MYVCFLCELPVILVRLQSNLNFFDRVIKNPQMRNVMEVCPVEAELLHADRWIGGRTDRRDKANSRFWKFCASA
jgi:hypothetical protein